MNQEAIVSALLAAAREVVRVRFGERYEAAWSLLEASVRDAAVELAGEVELVRRSEQRIEELAPVATFALDRPLTEAYAQGRTWGAMATRDPSAFSSSRMTPPALSAASTEGANALWYHRGDLEFILLDAARGDQDASKKEERLSEAKEKVEQIRKAMKVGYRIQSIRAGGKGTVKILVREGRALTQRGAEALVSGTVPLLEPASGDPRIGAARAFARLFASFPDQNLDSLQAISAALSRSELGKSIGVERDERGWIALRVGKMRLFEPTSPGEYKGTWVQRWDSSPRRFVAFVRLVGELDDMPDETVEQRGEITQELGRLERLALEAVPPETTDKATGLLIVPAKPKPQDALAFLASLDPTKRLDEGTITLAELREMAARTFDSEEEAKRALASLPKADLERIARRRGTKEQLVRMAWGALVSAYELPGFGWWAEQETKEQSVRRQLAEATDEDLAKRAAEAKERDERRQRDRERLANPKTYDDWRDLTGRLKLLGRKLKPDAQRAYDEAEADEARRIAEEKLEKRAEARAASPVVAAGEVVETKHTKTQEPLYVVQLGERVEPDAFRALSARAKALGGYYSSYRGGGAIPGFTFRARDDAEAFARELGPRAPAEPAEAAPVAEPEEGIEGNAPERLRAQAETLEENGKAILAADRQTNTLRRATMAASAESSAFADLAKARSLRAIANGVELGELKHLWTVKTKAHAELLERALQKAKWERDRAAGLRYEQSKETPPTEADVEGARLPYPTIHREWAEKLVLKSRGVAGAKMAGEAVGKALRALDPDKHLLVADDEELRRNLEKLAEAVKRADPKDTYAENVLEDFATYRRATEGLGLRSDAHLRAVLREYLTVRSVPEKASKIEVLKRGIVGRNIEGFFPTPPSVVRLVMERAEMVPGQRVLEPSAGTGNLADAAKAAGGLVEVAEVSPSLREILAEKGYPLVGADTLELRGSYDRVVMNPPFERGQDIEHVRHAYDAQLAPGGRLVAIVSRGSLQRSDAKARAFQAWLGERGALVEDLPEGAFAAKESERKTGVATSLIVIDKAR